MIAAIDSVYGKPKYLLLDEIQNLPRWELFVNRLQRQGYHLYLTGSNAHLLSSELATHLTGRHRQIILFPFSFTEYISSLDTELTQAEMTEALRTYIEQGGMPEPLCRDVDRVNYLRTLWDSVIYKDIVKRHRIRSVAGIEDLAGYLLANVASEYSFTRLTEVTKCRSVHTVQKYISHLEEAFLFFSLQRFSIKVKEQARANRKIYCIDNGFVTACGFRFRDNTGALFENTVAIMLRKQQLEGEFELFFWRGTRDEEVDFVIKKRNQVTQLIQVCWDMQAAETRSREVRALIQASKALFCDDLVIITATQDSNETVAWYGTRRQIRLIPFAKWCERKHEQGR
jgi:predicted AAA+ superfamily ATPase